MSTKQLDTWKSQFGIDWTDRNQVDPDKRIEPLKKMLGPLSPKTVLEVGCGAGHNLVALKTLGILSVYGIDPLEYSVKQAQSKGLNVIQGDCFKIPYSSGFFDLVFTAGVLMHVAPDDFERAITEMTRVSKSHLACIEYFSKKEKLVKYRDEDNLLWKRNYRDMIRALGPKCTRYGHFGNGSGFDGCHFWVFEKKGYNPCSKSPIGQHHWMIEQEVGSVVSTMTCKYCQLVKHNTTPTPEFIKFHPYKRFYKDPKQDEVELEQL